MPKNKIGRHMLGKLKLVVGTTHDHQAQNPIPLAALSGRPTAAGALWNIPKPPKPKVERPATEVAPVASIEAPAAEVTPEVTPSAEPTA